MAVKHRAMNALEGAAGYGASGAAIGSAIPGVGTGIGAGIGAGVGLLAGLLSSTEAQELAERYSRGEIDPNQQEAIAEALQRRYHAMQLRYGTSLARRGLTDSTIAARLQAQLSASEGRDLAMALAQTSNQNVRLGRDMMAEQAAARQATFGRAASMLGNLYLLDRQERQHQDWLDLYGRDMPVVPPAAETPPMPVVPPKANTVPIPGGGGTQPSRPTNPASPQRPAVSRAPARPVRPARTVPGQRTGGNHPLSGSSNVRNRMYAGGGKYGSGGL